MRVWIFPIPRDTGPLGAESFLVDIRILNDESLKPLRMLHHDAEADWAAVVVEVEGIFADPELLEEIIDGLRQVIKGIRVLRWRRGIALTETREVRRHHVTVRGKQWNERIKLTRGRRKSMQEHD